MEKQQMIEIVQYISAVAVLPAQYMLDYWFYKNFLGFKSKAWKFILCIILVSALDLFMMRSVSETLRIIVNILLSIVIVCVFCKRDLVLKIYAAILKDAITVLISLALLFFDFKLFPHILKIKMSFNTYLVMLFISNLLSDLLRLVLLYVFLKCICKLLKIKEKQVNIYEGMYLLVPCLASYSFAAFFYIIQEIKINNKKYYLPDIFPRFYCTLPFISSALLLSLLITAYTFNKMLEGKEEKQKNMLMEQQLKLQLNHTKNTENLYRGIRSVMHDMNNHLACLRILADADKTEEIKKYLNNIGNTINKLDFKIKTGNPISDAVINEKYNIARLEGISFLCDFICPAETSIEPVDLCIILSNVLDNAIEACKKLGAANIQKEITIKSYIKNKYLIIEVSNTKNNKLIYDGDKIITTKPDGCKHGIGIQNIQAAVRKYNGVTDIIEDKDKFNINIMLPL